MNLEAVALPHPSWHQFPTFTDKKNPKSRLWTSAMHHVVAAAVLAMCLVGCSAADCPPGWHAYDDGSDGRGGGEGHDSCVRVFTAGGAAGQPVSLSHSDAGSVCWRHGAHLLTIRSTAAGEGSGSGLLAVALRLTAGEASTLTQSCLLSRAARCRTAVHRSVLCLHRGERCRAASVYRYDM